MNRTLSVAGRTPALDVLEGSKERAAGGWGRVGLAVAIVVISLGLLYLPYFLELFWS